MVSDTGRGCTTGDTACRRSSFRSLASSSDNLKPGVLNVAAARVAARGREHVVVAHSFARSICRFEDAEKLQEDDAQQQWKLHLADEELRERGLWRKM